MASGEKVIAAQGFADKLRAQWPECISVEMEAAGVAYACQGTGTGFLVVKAVLDPADSSKNDDYRAFACGAAAAFVKSLLEDSELPALTQPSVMEVPLGDLFGLKRNSPTCIILPGYLNERHKECGVLNYPYNLYESAFDDVYSALRIVPAIEAYCGRKNVMFYFADETHPSSPPNTIFIGSSVVNAGTRHALANAYFRFGIEAQDHDIIDRNGTVRFSAKYIPVQGKRTLVMDYALMSAFDLHGERVVILAGCRAYGQIALGDMLSKPQFVRESLLREFAGDDFQCVVEVEVAGRTHRPGQIVASAVHGQKEDWRER